MSYVERNLSRLSQKDIEFLKLLVHFGGACTRRSAAMALEMKDKENARQKLKRFVDLGFLVANELSSRMPNGPTVYFPSRAIAQRFGCDRRETKDLEQTVEKCFKFLVAVSNREREPVNYLRKPSALKLNDEKLKEIQSAHRDEAYLPSDSKVLVDIHPTWSLAKAKNRILFWAHVKLESDIEIWTPAPEFALHVAESLAPEIKKRIVAVRHKYDPLSTSFLRLENSTGDSEELVSEFEIPK